MNRFAIARPKSFDQAVSLLGDSSYSLPVLKAGGMDVVDHLKEGLLEPDLLIDIKNTRRRADEPAVMCDTTHLQLAAGATLSEIAKSPLVKESAPALAYAAESAATPQVRNVATAAGNLLQRPRCWYYRHSPFDCLKKGGHQCFAVEGENEYHAIFGSGPCHIVHPSNIAVPLNVMNATVHLTGGDRESIPIIELYHLPDRGIRDEHNLEPTEIITHISCAQAKHSGFYAIKHKQSFDWPLVMAAVNLELDGSTIRSATTCAGAVAPVPWRLTLVDRALKGVDVDDDTTLREACDVASRGAKPMSGNAYKARLLPVAVFRAVKLAAGRTYEGLS